MWSVDLPCQDISPLFDRLLKFYKQQWFHLSSWLHHTLGCSMQCSWVRPHRSWHSHKLLIEYKSLEKWNNLSRQFLVDQTNLYRTSCSLECTECWCIEIRLRDTGGLLEADKKIEKCLLVLWVVGSITKKSITKADCKTKRSLHTGKKKEEERCCRCSVQPPKELSLCRCSLLMNCRLMDSVCGPFIQRLSPSILHFFAITCMHFTANYTMAAAALQREAHFHASSTVHTGQQQQPERKSKQTDKQDATQWRCLPGKKPSPSDA